jgi:hypothetical protein
MGKVYTPSPTILDLMLNFDQRRVNMLLGPIGGGKTTGIIMLLIMIAQNQAPDVAGLRKTRFGVARNTRPQLRDSVLKSVFDWLPPNGSSIIWMETDMTLKLNYKLPDDTYVKSEWMFRALDDQRDAARLLSVEYTCVWLSEFREIPFALLTDVLSRTGRYPAVSEGGATYHGVIAESNFPTRGSDWHRYLELETSEISAVYKQPSGLSPEAENLQYLKPDYYSVLMETATPGWVQAHILCEYPDSLDGKAVFGSTFDYSRHVAAQPLLPIGRGSMAPTLLMGVDQGRSPGAVFSQVQPNGCLHVLQELYASNVSMMTFARQYIAPFVAEHFPGMPILAIIDPAGTFKGQANDQTPAEALEANGFRVIPAPTNAIDRRLGAVDKLFLHYNGILISPECPVLINGLAADYRFETKKNGELATVPEKKHPISDVQDCLQYISLVAGGEHYGRVMARMQRGRYADTPPPNRGWT